jgi:hypothetical protein
MKHTRRYTVRFAHDEAAELVRVSRRLGMTVSGFVRGAAMAHARGAGPVIEARPKWSGDQLRTTLRQRGLYDVS